MKEPTKAPDTAMAKAIFDAKIRRTPEEHSAYLTQLAREAWQKCSAAGGSAVRRSHIRAALCNDPTYALMEQWQPDALRMAIGALLAKVREDIKAEATKQNAARKAAGGGQTLIDAQNGITPTETPSGDKPADNRDHAGLDTHASLVPVVTPSPDHARLESWAWERAGQADLSTQAGPRRPLRIPPAPRRVAPPSKPSRAASRRSTHFKYERHTDRPVDRQSGADLDAQHTPRRSLRRAYDGRPAAGRPR